MMAQYDTLHDLLKTEVKDAKEALLLSKWSRDDDRCMSIASLAALRSKDPHTSIGACIVDATKKVVGIGYNSMPYGVQPIGETNDDESKFPWHSRCPGLEEDCTKHPYVCHAAMNAVASKTIPDLTNCTMYLTQHPDEDCAHIIVESGIKEVKYQKNTNRGNEQYETNAETILQLHSVSIKQYNPKTEVSIRLLRKEWNWSQNFVLSTLRYWKPVTESLTLSLRNRITKVDNSPAKKKAQTDEYITWEELFMGLAQLETVYSNEGDPKPGVKVGACLVNSSKQIIAIGSSSANEDLQALGRRKVAQDVDHSLSSTNMYAHHAEYKTIASYKGIKDIKGCTLYVTKSPCNDCAKLIVQSGIQKVFYKDQNVGRSFAFSKTIFTGCNITFEQLECVKNVKIMKANSNIDQECMKSISTMLECTRLKRQNNNWYYYSLNLSVEEDYVSQYLINSTTIISSIETITNGNILIVPSSGNMRNLEDIAKLKPYPNQIKPSPIIQNYPDPIVVETGKQLCRVHTRLVNQGEDNTAATLRNDYSIYFDIFVRRKLSTKYKCKQFERARGMLDCSLKQADPSLDDTTNTFFFESLEVSSKDGMKRGDIRVVEDFTGVQDEWPFEFDELKGGNNIYRKPINKLVTTDTRLCKILEEFVVEQAVGIFMLKDDYEICFNIIAKRKQI